MVFDAVQVFVVLVLGGDQLFETIASVFGANSVFLPLLQGCSDFGDVAEPVDVHLGLILHGLCDYLIG